MMKDTADDNRKSQHCKEKAKQTFGRDGRGWRCWCFLGGLAWDGTCGAEVRCLRGSV
jgi:hypothetical protein